MNDTQRLVDSFSRGTIPRRTFVTRALALGISMGGIEAILQACGGTSYLLGADCAGRHQCLWYVHDPAIYADRSQFAD